MRLHAVKVLANLAAEERNQARSFAPPRCSAPPLPPLCLCAPPSPPQSRRSRRGSWQHPYPNATCSLLGALQLNILQEGGLPALLSVLTAHSDNDEAACRVTAGAPPAPPVPSLSLSPLSI